MGVGRVNYFRVCGCAASVNPGTVYGFGCLCFVHMWFEEIKQRRNEVKDDCS